MKGYLHNLTMRTLGSGNLIEPRLPSLFEAGPAAPGPPPQGAYEEEILSETTIPQPASPRGTNSISRTVEDSSPALNARTEDGPADVEINISSSETDEELESVSHNDNSRTNVDRVEAPPFRAMPSLEEEVFEPSPRLETQDSAEGKPVENSNSTRESGDMSPRGPSQTVSHTEAVSQQTTTRNLPSPPRFEESRRVPRTAQVRLPETQPVTTNRIEYGPNMEATEIELDDPQTTTENYRFVNPAPQTRLNLMPQPARWRRRQSFQAIESEPSINVTIGRVEVRAVPADNRKTTPSRRTESPVMPLEEYLRKQRRGGER